MKVRLGKLPAGLEDAYNEIYANIAAQGDHAKALAGRAVMWVMCALQPLGNAELLDAIRVDPRSETVQLSDELDEDLLLDICNNLLVLDPQREVWTFSHLSVAEYFEKNHWTLSQAHSYATGVCLLLVMEMRPSIKLNEPERTDGNLSDGQHDDVNETQPDQPHDAPHEESEVATDDDADTDHGNVPDETSHGTFDDGPSDAYEYPSIDDYNNSSNYPVNYAFNECSVDGEAHGGYDQYDIFDPRHPLQIYARYYWISHVHALNGSAVDPVLTRRLKAFLGSPSESSSHYRAWYIHTTPHEYWPKPPTDEGLALYDIEPVSSPVLLMCRFGLFSALADWWADAEIPTSLLNVRRDDLLTLAAAGDSHPILEALLRRGMLINLQPRIGSWLGNPLLAAVQVGDSGTVNFLLDRGAEINMRVLAGPHGSALAAAVKVRHVEVVRLLIEKGADIDMPLLGETCESALALAVHGGSREIAGILIEHGADVNKSLIGGCWGSALAAAVARSDWAMIDFLLDNGADINMPLALGHVDLLSMAVSDAGVYRNVAETPGWPTDMLRYLIQRGANVNAPFTTGSFGNALVAAAYRGLKDCVEILIEAGADVNLTVHSGVFRTALEAAEAEMSASQGKRLERDDYYTVTYAWKQEKAEIVELLRRHVSVSSQQDQ